MRGLKFAIPISLMLWLLIFAAWAHSAVYYVDTAANGDAGAGTSEAADVAWKTIAKVNASSFAAGDSILFKRGCTWREQLVVPSSGSAGSPITFGAYGSGANPAIYGSDTIATWTAEAGATNLHSNPEAVNLWGIPADVTVGQNVSAASSPDSTTTADSIIPANNASPHLIADYISGAPATQYTLSLHAKIADINKPWVALQVKFLDSGFGDLGSSGLSFFALYDSTVGTTSGVTTNYNLPSKENYRRLGVTITSPANTVYVVFYYLCAETDGDITFAGDGATAHSYVWGAKIEAGAAPTVYGTSYYAASITTENKVLYQDSTQLINFSDKGSLCAGSFWYDAANDRIYAKSVDLADPDTHTMTAGQRDYSIAVGNHDYITLSNIEIGGSNAYPAYINSSGANLAGIVIDGITSVYGSDGILISKCTAADIKNVNISNTTPTTFWTGGIVIANSTATLSDCIVHDGYTNGIVIAGGSTVTINRGSTYNMGLGSYYAKCGYSVVNTNTVIFNDAVAHNNTDDGFTVNSDATATFNCCVSYNNGSEWLSPINYSGDGFTSHDTAVMVIKYCIAYGNHKSGIGCINTGAGNTISNCVLYNNYNTVLDRGTTPYYKNNGIIIASPSGSWTIKNNITANNGTEINITPEAAAGATLAIDYNCYYDSRGGSAFHYDGTDYSFANYKTASSQDAHSINADPFFISPSTGDFHIQRSSPTIDVGTSIAGIHDQAGNTDFAGNRSPQRTNPSIGAYEKIRPVIRGIVMP